MDEEGMYKMNNDLNLMVEHIGRGFNVYHKSS